MYYRAFEHTESLLQQNPAACSLLAPGFAVHFADLPTLFLPSSNDAGVESPQNVTYLVGGNPCYQGISPISPAFLAVRSYSVNKIKTPEKQPKMVSF